MAIHLEIRAEMVIADEGLTGKRGLERNEAGYPYGVRV